MTYLPILTYHRLLNEAPTKSRDPKRIAVSQTQFRSHLATLHRFGYRTANLEQYARVLKEGGEVPRKHFAITFDDGYEELIPLALPVLKEFGFTATVFAVPGRKTNEWDDGSARLMTDSQLQTWERSGMTIGGHSCRHPHMTDIPLPLAEKELRDCRQQLETLLQHPVALFAYPYGESSPAVERAVQEAGYSLAFATDRASPDHRENPYRVRRVVIFPRNNSWEILWKVQSWYPRYQDWKRRG